MAEVTMTASQLEARRRREKILNNTKNRMALVTGQSDELKQPTESPVSASSSSSFIPDSAPKPSSQRLSTVIRTYKWPARILLAGLLSGCWLSVFGMQWIILNFLGCLLFMELLFFLLRQIFIRNFFSTWDYLSFLFTGTKQINPMDDYLDFTIIFLGLQGKRANLFRSFVMHGMQTASDVLVCFIVYVCGSLLNSLRQIF